MLRIELFRNGAPIETRQAPNTIEARKAVDAMLDAVHQGRHGPGLFRVTSFHHEGLELFAGAHFDSGPIVA